MNIDNGNMSGNVKLPRICDFSDGLFWDTTITAESFEKSPRQIISRVLEYGELNDWHVILDYYGLDRIADECQQMRTLDPAALSYISTISDRPLNTFRCYNTQHWTTKL